MIGKTSLSEKISYGLGSMGIALSITLITAFLTMYLTNVAFLDVAAVSLIMAVSRVFDGISDLVVGNVIDNTKSRFGKARVWLMRMSLPYGLSLLLLFMVPQHCPEMVKYIYVFILYNLANTVIRTFIQIAHYSLVALSSDDAMEQGLMGNIQSITMNLGMMAGSVIFVRLLGMFTDEPGNQNTQRAYTYAVMVFCAVMIVLTFVMTYFAKERVEGEQRTSDKTSEGIKAKLAEFKVVVLDRNWLVLVICTLLCAVVLQIRVTGATYYALYIMDDMNKVGWLNVFNMGASMVTQFFTPFLMKRFGMKKVFASGVAIAAASHLGFGLTTSSMPAMTAFLVMGGIGNGFFRAVVPGLFAVIITDIASRTGELRAGIGNAGFSTANKLGQGIGSVVFGFSLSAAGFDAMLDTKGMAQPDAVNGAISAMYIWIPMALFVVSLLIFVLFFDKEKRLDKVNTAV